MIRGFVENDWPRVWPIVRDVVQAQETFPDDPSMTAAGKPPSAPLPAD